MSRGFWDEQGGLKGLVGSQFNLRSQKDCAHTLECVFGMKTDPKLHLGQKSHD